MEGSMDAIYIKDPETILKYSIILYFSAAKQQRFTATKTTEIKKKLRFSKPIFLSSFFPFPHLKSAADIKNLMKTHFLEDSFKQLNKISSSSSCCCQRTQIGFVLQRTKPFWVRSSMGKGSFCCNEPISCSSLTN
ncbi:hypothetical protein ACOSQ3_021168 [Xanthoceras sorbifolium]